MALKPREVAELTLGEFNIMLTGYQRRLEHDKNNTRHLMAYVRAFAGMGASEWVDPRDVWPLYSDKEDIKRMISTMAQAIELFKEFQ